jgi:hypothetical protein
MRKRQFAIDLVATLSTFISILGILQSRGTVVLPSMYGLAALGALGVAISMQRLKIRGSAEGGWLFVLVLVIGFYLIVSRPLELSVGGVLSALERSFRATYPMLVSDAGRFREAYIILLSAAFTLYAIFFIVVRRIDLLVAVRLVTIGDGFAAVFLAGFPALLFADEGWWRLAMMAGLNFTSLLALSRDPRPYIVSYGSDSGVSITFWESYLRMRRGWVIWAAVGLVIMPLYPVLGEVLFVLSLLYVLYAAARGATFLYISTQLPDDDALPSLLSSLFHVAVSKRTSALIEKLQRNTVPGPKSTEVTQIPFFIGQPKPPEARLPEGEN